MGEIIVGLILIIFALYLVWQIILGIFWFFAHIVPWLAVFLIPAAILYFYLRTERVQLTAKSAAAVFLGCGGVAWLGTTLIVHNQMGSYYALAIAPGFYFTSVFLLLTTWAAILRLRARSLMDNAAASEDLATRRVAHLERRLEGLRAEQESIASSHGQSIAECQSIADGIVELRAVEPRALGLVASDLQEAARRMPVEELQAALAAASSPDGGVGSRLRSMVLRHELLSRSTDAPAADLESCQSALVETEERLARARGEHAKAHAKAEHHAELYRAFASGPITL